MAVFSHSTFQHGCAGYGSAGASGMFFANPVERQADVVVFQGSAPYPSSNHCLCFWPICLFPIVDYPSGHPHLGFVKGELFAFIHTYCHSESTLLSPSSSIQLETLVAVGKVCFLHCSDR